MLDFFAGIWGFILGMAVEDWKLATQVIFATASLVVAVAAGTFSYRANYGWEPIVLISKQGISRDRDKPESRPMVTVTFEIWNRRKYPIVIRSAAAYFPDVPAHSANDWHTFEGEVVWLDRERSGSLAPNEPHSFTAKMYVNSAKEINEAPFVAQVEYFDPLKNKQIAIQSKIKFMGLISRRRWARRLNKFGQDLLQAMREA